MGFFMKALIFIGVIIGAAVILAPSPEERTQAAADNIDELVNAVPDSDVSAAELQQIFQLGSSSTDVQRDNKEEEIKGKVVEWDVEVYEVNKRGDDTYRVQSIGNDSSTASMVNIHIRSPEEATYIESLKTGDRVQFKGRISGTTIRHIEFDDAILTNVPSS